MIYRSNTEMHKVVFNTLPNKSNCISNSDKRFSEKLVEKL